MLTFGILALLLLHSFGRRLLILDTSQASDQLSLDSRSTDFISSETEIPNSSESDKHSEFAFFEQQLQGGHLHAFIIHILSSVCHALMQQTSPQFPSKHKSLLSFNVMELPLFPLLQTISS